MKYIDADRLRAEIERRIHEISHPLKDGYEIQSIGKIEGLSELLEVIDYLQQEQLDVNKIKRDWYNKGYLEGRKNAHIPARELGLPKSWDFQDEQPEVDLEKEVHNYLKTHHLHIKDGGRVVFDNDDSPNFMCDIRDIARHFYELGLNARK